MLEAEEKGRGVEEGRGVGVGVVGIGGDAESIKVEKDDSLN